MKWFFCIAFCGIVNIVFSQFELPYSEGEYVSYKIYFGPINVGFAELEVTDALELNNKKTLHIIGKGRTAIFFDWFFKVRDIYETVIDTKTLLPVLFKRSVKEGGYSINQRYEFYHNKNKVVTQDSSFFIPVNTQDMLSAFFLARTFRKKDINKKEPFYIPIFMDNENYNLEIKYLGDQIVRTKWGNVKCMVFQPKMQEGRVFQDGEQMKIWITDDKNHLLLRVETKIWAGKITAVLQAYKELKNEISIIRE